MCCLQFRSEPAPGILGTGVCPGRQGSLQSAIKQGLVGTGVGHANRALWELQVLMRQGILGMGVYPGRQGVMSAGFHPGMGGYGHGSPPRQEVMGTGVPMEAEGSKVPTTHPGGSGERQPRGPSLGGPEARRGPSLGPMGPSLSPTCRSPSSVASSRCEPGLPSGRPGGGRRRPQSSPSAMRPHSAMSPGHLRSRISRRGPARPGAAGGDASGAAPAR